MSRAAGGSSLVRPVRLLGPLAATVLAVMVWAAIAHNSGSGWVQALGAILGSVLVVALVGPAFALRGVSVRCVSNPGDAVVGTEVALILKADRRVRIQPIGLVGDETFAGPQGNMSRRHGKDATSDLEADRSGEGTLVVLAERRQVIGEVKVEVATCAPFGLQWWARTMTVPLPRPLYVSPRPGASLPIPYRSGDRHSDQAVVAGSSIGDPRGIRPYQPGDSHRQVHWPATAHSNRLMVRESEQALATPSAVEVVLPSEPAAEREIAELAAGTIASLLRRGDVVTIVSDAGLGSRSETVRDRRSAGRVLARAVPEPDRAPGVWIR